jgi:hypothetical protein
MAAQADGIIRIPYTPRPLQRQIHTARGRFAVVVCHRRFGKTVMAINDLIKAALTCQKINPRFHYIAPQLKMAKAIAWDYLKQFTRNIPGREFNEAELRVDFPVSADSVARIRLYGSDNPDTLRGAYSDGVVFDEYAMADPRLFAEVCLPMLTDRKGWALFMGTPLGPNHFMDVWDQAAEPDMQAIGWSRHMFKASETGILTPEDLKIARKMMTDAQYEQEMECSFTAAVPGAYYTPLLAQAEKEGRVCDVPWDPAFPVEAWFDLGVRDAASVWIVQRDTPHHRVLAAGELFNAGIPDYIDFAKELAKPAQRIDRWVGPHDLKQRDMSLSGAPSRVDVAATHGANFEVMGNRPKLEGIDQVRLLLPLCKFDRKRTQDGRNALMSYRSGWDGKNQTLRLVPIHDWSSHYADAFRTGAMAGPSSARMASAAWEEYMITNQFRPSTGGFAA